MNCDTRDVFATIPASRISEALNERARMIGAVALVKVRRDNPNVGARTRFKNAPAFA